MSETDAESPTARLSAFAAVSNSEMGSLSLMAGPEKHLRRGDFIWREGERLQSTFLLVTGWAASTMTFADGARQMLRVHLAGDMLGLPSLSLKRAAESVMALEPITVRAVPFETLGVLFEQHQRLAALLFLVSQQERVQLMDRLASIGRTTAMQRIAGMMLQLHTRVQLSFPDTAGSFHLPLTQQDLADLVGLTTAHTNRTLKEMRAEGVLSWSRQKVTIPSVQALRDLADLPERELALDTHWLPSTEE